MPCRGTRRANSMKRAPASTKVLFDKGLLLVYSRAVRSGSKRRMQRVRIGLTGLAFVFLAVLLAAVFTRRPSGEGPITPNTIEQQQTGAAPSATPPAEPADPLATMKVAPGDSDSNGAASQQSAPPVPARR